MIESIIEPLQGWCTKEKAERLFQLIKETDSQLTVELGVFGGKSLIPMGVAHREKGSGVVIGIDAWKAAVSIQGTNSPLNDEYWKTVDYSLVWKSCNDAIIVNQIFDYCTTLKIASQQAFALFDKNSIDVLHQDSGHNIETITDELKLWSPLIKKGGLWIIDDCNWVEAVEGYAKLPEYGFELMEDYTTWQVWKKK